MSGLSTASEHGVVLMTVGLLIAIVWIINNFLSQRNKSIPYGKHVPGSIGWPIIGHMPYLNLSNMYPHMEYYTKKYGPIFRIKLGSYESVVINDYNLIKKAFSSKDLIAPLKFLTVQISSMGGHGLAFSKEHIWQEQRRFAMSQLRYLGMGKSSLESNIHAEINALFTEWKKTIGKPVDVKNSLNICTTNIMWSIVAGQRMEYNDSRMIELLDSVNNKIEFGSAVGPITLIPWIIRVFPKRFFKLDCFIEALKSFNRFSQEIIDGHKQTVDHEDPKDFIDHFLVKQKKEENNPETTFTNTQLLVTIADLFSAGGESTATTLRWAILLISRDPVVQKRIQVEIDQIIGHDRYPTMADCDKMPYTVAVTKEVSRFADIGSTVFHASSKDTSFEGYHIPMDSIVIGLLGCVHRNPKYWAKPYEFYPEHFLDAEGKLRQKVDGYFPFSTGKRHCPGEELARMEIFDFIVSFFQHFNMRLANFPAPSLEADPKSGLIRWPKPYKVIMEERCHC